MDREEGGRLSYAGLDAGSGADLLKLKKFISTLKTVEKIELLPYHDMGKYKWKKVWREGNQAEDGLEIKGIKRSGAESVWH